MILIEFLYLMLCPLSLIFLLSYPTGSYLFLMFYVYLYKFVIKYVQFPAPLKRMR